VFGGVVGDGETSGFAGVILRRTDEIEGYMRFLEKRAES
jgi:hypothetical protein